MSRGRGLSLQLTGGTWRVLRLGGSETGSLPTCSGVSQTVCQTESGSAHSAAAARPGTPSSAAAPLGPTAPRGRKISAVPFHVGIPLKSRRGPKCPVNPLPLPPLRPMAAGKFCRFCLHSNVSTYSNGVSECIFIKQDILKLPMG